MTEAKEGVDLPDCGLTESDVALLADDEELGLEDFDAAAYLKTPEHIAAYLTRMLEGGDDGMLASALGDVARSVGMAKVAEKTGIGREALYKALRDGATPRLNTVNKVVKALGMRMVIIEASAS
ncbi:putative addiction module antidote protein [Duganella sp. 1411]|uniref:addiction module antidote protein n=1 Tax=Duganella sp. 1411 TaxID=2806572 RepID=UPI001AE11678|nr:addiction module antidote protein [Duganella sp. 1411]MBP1202219.1 putative addiction module antidote protein [Duganella sp. 1411]